MTWTGRAVKIMTIVLRRLAGVLPVLVILGTALLAVVAWFRGPFVLYYVDNFVPFNPARELPAYISAWNDLSGTGVSNGSNLFILPFLGYFRVGQAIQSPVWLSQIVLFFLLFGGSGVSFYVLARHVFSASLCGSAIGKAAATCGALLYMLNPYSMFMTWSDGMPFLGIMMAFMPLFLLSLWHLTEFPLHARPSLFWLGVFIVSASMTFLGNVPYILSPVLLAIGVIVIRLGQVVSSPSLLLRRGAVCLGLIGLILAVNAWWLAPEFLLSVSSSYVASLSTMLNQNYLYYSTDVSHSSLLSIMSLGGIENAYAGSQAYDYLYQSGSSFLLLGLGLFGFASAGLLVMPKSTNRIRLLHAGALFGLLATFSTLINEGPGSQLVGWLVLNSSFWSPFLRYPFAALGAEVAFLFSFTFALSTASVGCRLQEFLSRSRSDQRTQIAQTQNSKLERRFGRAARGVSPVIVLAVFAVLFVGIYSFPLLSGDVIPTTLIGVSGSPVRVEVPAYEQSLANFLSANSPPFKDLLYPPGLLLVHQNWAQGYVGGPLLPDLSGVQTVSSPIQTSSAESTLLPPLTYFDIAGQESGNFTALLTMLGVKYIVVDPTISSLFTDVFSPGGAITYLTHQSGLVQVGNFSPAVVFENLRPLPPVFASSQVDTLSISPQGTPTNLLPAFCAGLTGGPSLPSGLISPPYGSVSCLNGNRTLSATYLRPPGNFSNGTYLGGPGFPSVSNTVPLAVNIPLGTAAHYLLVNLSMGTQTGISVYFSNYSLLNSTNIGTGALNSAMPVLPLSSTDILGPDQYAGNVSLLVDLHDANGLGADWPTLYTVLNYLLFSIFPISGGKPVPLVDMGKEIGFNMTSLEIVDAPWSFATRGFDPDTTVLVGNATVQSMLMSSGSLSQPQVSFTKVDSSEYTVRIADASGPFILNLAQTFDPSWELQPESGQIASSEHFEGDLYLNSWLVVPREGNLTVELFFSAQTTLNYTLFGSYAFPLAGSILIGTGIVLKRWPRPRHERTVA
jgi:hypothetical protein